MSGIATRRIMSEFAGAPGPPPWQWAAPTTTTRVQALTGPSLTAHRAEWQRAPPERWSLAQCDEPLKEWVLQLDGAWEREEWRSR